MARERLLIIGGGFGGVKAALEMANDNHFETTLLTDHPNFRYYPTLYRTATGGRRIGSSIALTQLFENHTINLIIGKAVTLDRKAKTITTDTGKVLQFDTLILSLGVVTNFFNIKGLAEFAFSIKTNYEAVRLKNHLHQQLMADHKPDLNYVIVGAGPTGIELAGVLPQYLKSVMKIHGINRRPIHVDLIEAAPRLLPNLPRDSSRMVRHRLTRLGVKLYLGQAVQGETADELTVNGRPILSHTVVWTAGVTKHPFFAENGFSLNKRGKVSVDVYLQAEPDIYVIGDNANTPYSGMAQTAIHDARYISRNLKRKAENKSLISYNAKKPVTVIPAGSRWAALLWRQLRIYGWFAWALREAADIIGFHDFEPWHKAYDQWFAEFSTEEDCPVCATKLSN